MRKLTSYSHTITSSLLFVSFAVHLAGCSLISGKETSQQGNGRHAKLAEPDAEIIRSSEALHSYLVGQLRYEREEYDEALKEFAKTRELMEGPQPEVHRKLAELYLREGDLSLAATEARAAKEAGLKEQEILFLTAGILDVQGDLNGAKEQYDLLLQDDKAPHEARILLLDILYRLGESTRVQQLFKQLEELAKKDSAIRYFIGRALERQGDIVGAERSIAQAYAEEPRRLVYLLDLVRLRLKLQNSEGAHEILIKALKQDPANIVIKRVAAVLTQRPTDIMRVLGEYDVVPSLPGDTLDTRFRIALHLVEKQDIGGAIRELSLVLAKAPLNADARYYLGTLFVGAGRKKEGVAEFLKITSESKIFVKSRTLVAFVLRQEKEYQRAAHAIDEALKVEKGNRQLLDYLIVILREGKEYARAERELRLAIERTPEDLKLRTALALVLLDLGKREEAERMMDAVLSINDKDAEALNFVAYSLAETGRELDRALKYVQRALELQPKNGYFLDTLAWVYFQRKEYDSAKSAIEQAIAIAGNDVVLLEHHGEILLALGERSEAVALFKKALDQQADPSNSEEMQSRERIQQKLSTLSQ
jgi:tetratricopeptide (TPR) repeat protein